jgi:hypothetical protein
MFLGRWVETDRALKTLRLAGARLFATCCQLAIWMAIDLISAMQQRECAQKTGVLMVDVTCEDRCS